ncbi:hypothetical protein SHAM105786_16835 [Shewanella amazonensis]
MTQGWPIFQQSVFKGECSHSNFDPEILPFELILTQFAAFVPCDCA